MSESATTSREVPWWRRLLPAVAAVAALLGAAWFLRSEPPRELAFPVLDVRAPFPELAPRTDAEEDAEERGTGTAGGASSGASRFQAALRQRALAGPSPAPAPPAPAVARPPSATPAPAAPVQTVPLGGGLVADLPAGAVPGGSWRWSSTAWGTLALHAPPTDRPSALLYTEPFSPAWALRPTLELLRFRWTALPAGAEDLPLAGGLGRALRDGAAAGSGAELVAGIREGHVRATATGGRGLGFVPAEDGATGTRWAARNDHRVVLRLGRFDGSWNGRVPAYLLLGSAAAPGELFGVHLALLCTRSPECPAAEDLAALLASIRPADPGRIDRLRQGAQESLEVLAEAAGLELTEPKLQPAKKTGP